MRTEDFDYPLPSDLIAQTPIEPRDASRLLVIDRAGGAIAHRDRFTDIMDYLRPGDLLVFNDSRVIPARLYGRRADTGGTVELLLLHRTAPRVWRCLAKPAKRLREGARVTLEGNDAEVEAHVVEALPDGVRTIEVLGEESALERVGVVPLPPYIRQPLEDPERYQTVYARISGSAAAPTAGLHFTPDLLARLEASGIEMAFVTLHVGLDTFRPVQAEDPRRHRLHQEYYEISEEAAAAVNRARAEGRRVVCVGTTTVRVLESAAATNDAAGAIAAGSGWTGFFILPGHRFRVADALVTNFHLPRSTLLMLVSAFAGRDLVLRAYQEAVERRYRFYSLGDATVIL